jgi:hypothetical protein
VVLIGAAGISGVDGSSDELTAINVGEVYAYLVRDRQAGAYNDPWRYGRARRKVSDAGKAPKKQMRSANEILPHYCAENLQGRRGRLQPRGIGRLSGISTSTLYEWQPQFPQFSEKFTKSRRAI